MLYRKKNNRINKTKKQVLRIVLFLGLGSCLLPTGPALSQEAPVTITAIQGNGGIITPSGTVSVSYGGTQTFTISPYAGNSAQLTVDGNAVSMVNDTYTFTNVTTSHTISVSFSLPSGVASFNVLGTTWYNFSPGSSTLGSGYPTVTTTTGSTDSVGWQDGAFVNNKAIYFPWQVGNGGTSWLQSIQNGIAQSVIVSYNAANGVAGFNNPDNWSWFDLSTLNWEGKGTVPNEPAGFMGGAVLGNMVYPTPDAHHQNPVFIQYDSSQPLSSPGAYQTFVPPLAGNSSVLGTRYGWCSAISDGRYVYYVPLSDPSAGNSGNIFRYDTTQPFSNLSSWTTFDMRTQVNANATAFQSASYDGNRYIYFVPFHNTLIVRYDTWGGGSVSNPSAFTNPASYTTLDPTLLNTSGYPTIMGQGNAANLRGFTGSAIAWDSANENEYLYLVPWATYPGNSTGGAGGSGAQNPVPQSTTARVRVGTQSGSTWSPVDITSTTTNPLDSPNWEIFDLAQLTLNGAWPTAWPITYTSGNFAGSNTLAGWQMSFVTPATASSPSMVGFGADLSQYLVEHDVDHDLYDPSGWYVTAPVPNNYHFGTMGGGFDSIHHVMYASSPGSLLNAVGLTSSNTVTITSSAGMGGTITPSGILNITYGANQTFTVTPNANYIAHITVDGVAVTLTNNTYTFNDVTVPHEIAATFSSIPAVTINSPANGSSFPQGSYIGFTTSATETNGTITQVQYFNGSTVIGGSLTSPYVFGLSDVSPGSYTFTAKAMDANGVVVASSPVTVTVVAGTPPSPTVALTSPTNGSTFAAGSTINFTTNATETNGIITQVQYFSGSTLIGGSLTSPYIFGWANVPAGTYTFTAKAMDANGVVVTSSPVTVVVS